MAPKLPPELFHLIFPHLQKADLKPLRFVGRMFNDLIVPFLFDKIYISPQYLNLTVFRHTSESLRLAKHVKELVYDATEFDNIIDEQGRRGFRKPCQSLATAATVSSTWIKKS